MVPQRKVVHHEWRGKGHLLLGSAKTGRTFSLTWMAAFYVPETVRLFAFMRINGSLVESADKADCMYEQKSQWGGRRTLEVSLRTPFRADDDVEIEIVSYEDNNGIKRAQNIINGRKDEESNLLKR